MLLPFLEVEFAVPIKVAAALYIFGPMATPFRNLRLFHAVEAWRVGLNVQHWALVGSVRIGKSDDAIFEELLTIRFLHEYYGADPDLLFYWRSRGLKPFS